MPLHTKYRPTKLEDIVGNETTVAALESALDRKNADLPHVFLFQGAAGTGKTTLARICAQRLGVAPVDLCEINVASERGIDKAREIQEQMRLRPMGGGRRAWIMDEIHMGTRELFNAMLKPWEETPDHVFFFLCTSEPQKLTQLSAAVKRRCHVYKLELLGSKQVVAVLADVADAEKVDVPAEVLAQIAADSGGSVGQALAVLDKVIDMPAAKMLAAARQAAAETAQAIELCRALLKPAPWPQVAAIIKALGEFDAENVRQAVLGYCNAVMLGAGKEASRAWAVYDAFRDPLDRNGRSAITYMALMASQSNGAPPF